MITESLSADTTRRFRVRPARTEADLRCAQQLRYAIFAGEGGAGGPTVDHAARVEAEPVDAVCRHLLLESGDAAVGTARLLDRAGAARAGGFVTAREFDIESLVALDRPLLELGRLCLAPEARGGIGLHRLWQGIADVAKSMGEPILFGVASLPEDDEKTPSHVAWLMANAALTDSWRPTSRAACDLPNTAPRGRPLLPPLLEIYLRMGGRVGQGAFHDRDFRCVDVCVVLDTAEVPVRYRRLYALPDA